MQDFRPAGAAASPALTVRLRPFQPSDEQTFRRLNEAWIAKYFRMEDKDRIVLADPAGEILKPGGRIFMACVGSAVVGCCALLRMGPATFELAKMAVAESHQGQGIGRKLVEHTIAQARTLGASGLYLETNSRLANAIHLYESAGFRRIPPERMKPSPYARADVQMEMTL